MTLAELDLSTIRAELEVLDEQLGAIQSMTVAQLRSFVAEHKIHIPHSNNKDRYLGYIKRHLLNEKRKKMGQ